MRWKTNCTIFNTQLRIKFRKRSLRSKGAASMLQVTSCYAGANQRGQKGEQNRAENEQIQRQRKESKGTSEVRRQRHCARTTIKAAPTVSTRPASENIATTTSHIQTAPNQRAAAGRLLLL